tara:strand:- start:280 stop:684 length:405 start_codon:yes stop_codon:yes gene_type:complete
MDKKSKIKTLIRQIVREEVAMAIHEVIVELKQPRQLTSDLKVNKPSKKKIVDKKEYSKNPILNEVLSDTANNDEWKSMGDGTYTTDKINDIALRQNNDSVNSNGTISNDLPNFLTKDYRSLMKAIDNKKKRKLK